MNTAVKRLLEQKGSILCLDIGSGTQDVLLASPGLEPENWTQLVLPSPARLVAQRVAALTAAGKHIWLYGGNMGGGFGRALKAHMQAGLRVSSTLAASRAVHDNPAVVTSMGIEFAEQRPCDSVGVFLADYSPEFWSTLLRQLGLPQPAMVAACAQDHGYCQESNRMARMHTWRALLEHSVDPAQWIYEGAVPENLTRLAALQAYTGGAVADSATAAVLGALSMPEVADRSFRQGVSVINVGNGHIVAMLLYHGGVRGIFEHHTGMRTQEEYLADLKEFRLQWLPDEQVRATGGHGTAFAPYSEEAGGFVPTYILGPQRAFLAGQGQYIAPCGNMMLAGCYGLLHGMAQRFSS
jgi:uncharacterized protein (DUF1786 family)